VVDIFISYARRDLEAATRLAKALGAQGWSVFWDRTIPTGKTWREVIGAALKGSRCVIVLWSQQSVTGHWVLEEADQGLKRGVLIPVFIENVEPPLGFASIQAADLSKWKGRQTDAEIQSLFGDVISILGPAPGKGREEKRRKAGPKRKDQEEQKDRELVAPRAHKSERKKTSTLVVIITIVAMVYVLVYWIQERSAETARQTAVKAMFANHRKAPEEAARK